MKSGLEHVRGERHLQLVLGGDGRDLVVHAEDFALVEPQALHDVMEGVGVDRLLERLAQQVLAALGVGDVAEDGQGDVVGDQALGGGEEAEVAHDHQALVGAELVALPEGDVGAHRHLGRHPVVGAAVEVVLPGPVVFQRHELVDVDRVAVDETLFRDVDAGTAVAVPRSRRAVPFPDVIALSSLFPSPVEPARGG